MGQFGVDLGDIVFPVRAVEFLEAELEIGVGIERAQIDGCLDELDTVHATAVRGAYLEGDTYQDLADRAGVPINTMRTWLRRSLAKLKDCLSR